MSGVDDDSNDGELTIYLPVITEMWEYEKIEQLGEKGVEDESWQCH
jgi:hypothetical protein